MSDANKQQVGGKHYKTDYEHWDLMLDHGLGIEYLIGQATKYVARWRKKNGIQDLQKALHFLNKLDENKHRIIFNHWRNKASGSFYVEQVQEAVDKFAGANALNEQEAYFCELLILMDSRESLNHARQALIGLMEQYDREHPDDLKNPVPVPLEDSNKHADRAEPDDENVEGTA